MILCHKCSGILASTKDENTSGLSGCGCISGWVRGFEPTLNREQAIAAQIKEREENIALFTSQGREQHWMDAQQKRLDALRQLVS